MLRITTYEEATERRWIIEGTLAGPWVDELRECWQAAGADDPDRALLIDLSAVTYIDGQGKVLLASMHRRGVKILAAGLLTHTTPPFRQCTTSSPAPRGPAAGSANTVVAAKQNAGQTAATTRVIGHLRNLGRGSLKDAAAEFIKSPWLEACY